MEARCLELKRRYEERATKTKEERKRERERKLAERPMRDERAEKLQAYYDQQRAERERQRAERAERERELELERKRQREESKRAERARALAEDDPKELFSRAKKRARFNKRRRKWLNGQYE